MKIFLGIRIEEYDFTVLRFVLPYMRRRRRKRRKLP
jgi:predicted alpha/beta-hydrolase family hydrolase